MKQRLEAQRWASRANAEDRTNLKAKGGGVRPLPSQREPGSVRARSELGSLRKPVARAARSTSPNSIGRR
jgi:hypothetical protein